MKQFAFGDSDEGQSIVTIEHDRQEHNPDEGFPRQFYRYSIVTERWEFGAADIYGAQDEPVDLDKASQSLFAFLHQCVTTENEEFPVNVRCWASRYIDEIAWLATPPDEEPETLAMTNGQLAPSDEEGVSF
jgi:hypothetical protein